METVIRTKEKGLRKLVVKCSVPNLINVLNVNLSDSVVAGFSADCNKLLIENDIIEADKESSEQTDRQLWLQYASSITDKLLVAAVSNNGLSMANGLTVMNMR